jgi:hypothetical protein
MPERPALPPYGHAVYAPPGSFARVEDRRDQLKFRPHIPPAPGTPPRRRGGIRSAILDRFLRVR